MECLVLVPQALQNVDGVRGAWLVNLDRLEAALESGVLLEVLAVLIQGGCAHSLELPTSQKWLQNARCVNSALGSSRTHQGVNLIDEHDDVSASTNLFGDFLQAFLKVTAVARPGDQRSKV